MLLTTLNYNQPELTDNLVTQLERDSTFFQHELMVVDNGSTKEQAKSTTHRLPENIFFGGGLNVILDYFLQTDHEYFVLFNNDLIFHGPRLIENMLREVRENNLDLYSPSITNSGKDQCHWKQMWNWGTGTVRKVDFIDFMCPIFSRQLAQDIQQFPSQLFLGWGPDFYAGIVAEEKGFKVGVSDNITLTHLVSQTFKTGAIDVKESDFCQQADNNMHRYFFNSPYKQQFLKLREKGSQYHA
jgi:GT2 family glycosyltransferase